MAKKAPMIKIHCIHNSRQIRLWANHYAAELDRLESNPGYDEPVAILVLCGAAGEIGKVFRRKLHAGETIEACVPKPKPAPSRR